MHLIGEFGQSK